MKEKTESASTIPQISLGKGILIYAILFVCFIGIVILNHASTIVTLMLASIIAISISKLFGIPYKYIEKVMIDHFAYIAVPILIALFAGFTVGEWMAGGVLPTAIYYMLGVINPGSILVTGFIACSVVSLLIGSAMGTIGTVGLVVFAVSSAAGVSAPMAIGAVVSGAYFGEKVSPMSQTNNAATGAVFGDVLDHSAFSARTGIIAFVIAAVVFAVMGGSGAADTAAIAAIREGLAASFKLNLLLLLPILVLIFLIVKKVHPIPAFALSGLLGLILAMTVQGIDLKTLLGIAYSGVKIDTGIAEVNAIIQRGGFNGMLSVMALYIGACTFTTVADASGARKVVTEAMFKNAQSDKQVILISQLCALVHLLGLGDAQVASYMSGNMLLPTYKERNLELKNLTRANCDICTSLSPMIPWTTGGLYVVATLGTGYSLFCIFNIVSVVLAVVLAVLGKDIAKAKVN